VEQQIFEAHAAPGSGAPGLRAALELLAAQPLPDRLWGVWVVHGHAPEEFAVVLRGHHALFDGLLLAEIIAQVLGAGPRPGRPARHRTRERTSTGQRGALYTSALRQARTLLGDRGRAAQPMPSSATLTGQVQYAWEGVELDRMRQAATAHQATSNDVYLAALAGALRLWAPDPTWLDGGRTVRVQVPVGDPAPSNGRLGARATAAWVRLPCHVDNPAARIAAVKAHTNRLRASLRDPHPGALTKVLTKFLGRFELDLQYHPQWTSMLTTHVPGPAALPSIAGRTVTAGMPLMFLPARQYVAAAMSDFAGTAHLCLVADKVVPRLEELARHWGEQVNLLADDNR
jgi:hypothetical protein